MQENSQQQIENDRQIEMFEDKLTVNGIYAKLQEVVNQLEEIEIQLQAFKE